MDLYISARITLKLYWQALAPALNLLLPQAYLTVKDGSNRTFIAQMKVNMCDKVKFNLIIGAYGCKKVVVKFHPLTMHLAVMCILEFVRDLKLVVTEPGIQACRTSHN